MPVAPPRVCRRCSKPAPKNGVCSCRPAWEGSTHPGNDRRWTKLRAAYLGLHPICEAPGCRRPAEEVDHKIPLAERPDLRYDWDNLASLCAGPGGHHTQKTVQDALRGKTRAR